MKANGKDSNPPKNKFSQDRFVNLLRQGSRALQRGQLAKSVKLLEQAYKLNPDQPDARLNLAGAYILTKKFKKAIALLEPLSRQQPGNPMIWTNLGAAYLGNPVLATDHHQQQAIAAFQKALDLNPAAPHVAYNIGLIYVDRQETDEALAWFQRALQVNPNDRDALYYINRLADNNQENEG